MISSYERKWLVQICLLIIPTVNLQIPMPMYPMIQPQIYAFPPPPPIAIPFPVPVPYNSLSGPKDGATNSPTTEKTTTSTTTTEKSENFYVAVPAPYPVPVPVYGPQPPPPLSPPQACVKNSRPANCPTCPCLPPPAPAPVYPFVPLQVFRPPPVLVLPFPPILRPSYHRPRHQDKSSRKISCSRHSDKYDSDESGSYESSRSDESFSNEYSSRSKSSRSKSSRSYRHKKKKKVGHALKRPKKKSRRNEQFSSSSNDKKRALVKPVLSYISKDGDVKIKQKLSKDEAFELMDEDTVPRAVQILAGDNSQYRPRVEAAQQVNIIADGNSDRQRVKIVSNIDMTKLADNNKSPARMQFRSAQQVLEEGKKEIVFKPPANKKITNLSVSFQIA